MKTFIESWSFIVFIIMALIALGGILYNLRELNTWKSVVNLQLNPLNPNERLVTFEACLQCQVSCRNNNLLVLTEIKETLGKHGDLLMAISNQVNRNEGKAGKS